MVDTARKFLIAGAFLMPMLTFRVAGHQTATTNTGLTLSDVCFFISAIFLGASVRRKKIAPTPVWHLGTLFVVVGGLTASYFAISPISSITVVARMIFVLTVWQWTIRHLLSDERWLKYALTAYVFGCSASGLVAILQLKAHVLISWGGLVNGRSFGLTHHPDDTGSFLALGLVIAVGLALHLGGGRAWWRVACIALIAIGLIFSGSVSGMLCGLIGCFVLLARRGVNVGKLIAVGVVLVGIYIGGTALQGNGTGGKSLNPIARFQAATGPESGGGNSVTPRIGTIKAAWDGVVASPIFGHGLDVESSLVYLDRNVDVQYPTHNLILMGWYQGGLFFLVGELICIGVGLRRLMRRGVRNAYVDMIFGGAVAVLVFSMQAPTMFDRYFWFPFVLATTFPAVTRAAARVSGRTFASPRPALTAASAGVSGSTD
jgi:hypothetical protein